MEEGILAEEKAQGATEYLLMLAAVLVVVAAAVYYVLQIQGSGTDVVTSEENNILDNLNNN